ncbi:hypothetical protein BREV_BREV_03114 [Brevundimonas mediterranea]|uniref:Uncharacterized protein n=1 Tax=Brevundimonas mediterranea TaxID=74329 RepID=A0A7Z8Y6V0_9CAUL|nr:hypothetical protein BREV_BREV_03114 [Brevundimonas mediterranea]
MAQPTARERRPGVRPADAVIDQTIGAHRPQQPAVEGCEPIRRGLAPDPLLGVHPRQVAQPLLRDLLGPRPEAVAHVVARNDQVATVGAPPAHQDMGVRLVGVVMAGRDPGQSGFAEIGRHPPHDLAHIGFHVVDPVPVLGRNDEAKMVSVPAPCLRDGGHLGPLPFAVEELRPITLDPGAGSSQVGGMRGQGRRPVGALAHVARHHGLDDDPLADIQAKGAARPVLGRAEHPRSISEGEHPGAGQTLHHPGADGVALDLQAQGKPDVDVLPRIGAARRQPGLHGLANEHDDGSNPVTRMPAADNSFQVISTENDGSQEAESIRETRPARHTLLSCPKPLFADFRTPPS